MAHTYKVIVYSTIVSNVRTRSVFFSVTCAIISHTVTKMSSAPQQTAVSLKHLVLDLLSAMIQEGQTSRWAIVCSMKLKRAINREICEAFMLP